MWSSSGDTARLKPDRRLCLAPWTELPFWVNLAEPGWEEREEPALPTSPMAGSLWALQVSLNVRKIVPRIVQY